MLLDYQFAAIYSCPKLGRWAEETKIVLSRDGPTHHQCSSGASFTTSSAWRCTVTLWKTAFRCVGSGRIDIDAARRFHHGQTLAEQRRLRFNP